MALNDVINPNDNSFGSVTNRAHGIIVNCKDPKQRGRVQVRIIGLHDKNKVPDDKLPWIHCMMNNYASNKGIGFFPPNYMVGSTVLLTSVGSQGWIVEGSLPNSAVDEKLMDMNRESTTTTPLSLLKNLQLHQQLLLNVGTDAALKLKNFGNINWQITDGIHKEIIKEAKVPIEYGLRTAAKAFDIPSIGFDKFSGDMKSAQNFIKGKIGDAGSVIPGALDMIKNLHSIKNTLGVPDPLSIIGQQNLLKAAKGLLDLIKKKKKQDEDSTPPEEKKEETEEERLAREAKEKELQDLIDNTEETPTS